MKINTRSTTHLLWLWRSSVKSDDVIKDKKLTTESCWKLKRCGHFSGRESLMKEPHIKDLELPPHQRLNVRISPPLRLWFWPLFKKIKYVSNQFPSFSESLEYPCKNTEFPHLIKTTLENVSSFISDWTTMNLNGLLGTLSQTNPQC